MFGYVRPYKAELKIKEFQRYRSIYCGLCQAIREDYGQIPRFSTSYDMTFLALLLLAMEGEDYGQSPGKCAFHPGQKIPVANSSEILRFVAAASVLLAYYKVQDNIDDREKILKNKSIRLLFQKAKKKATSLYPALAEAIERQMKAQSLIEKENAKTIAIEDASAAFAQLLEEIVLLAPLKYPIEVKEKEALVFFARELAKWIYTIDAVEDFEEDKQTGSWNPLRTEDASFNKEEVQDLLQFYEEQMDLAGQILPFYRDATILGNIIQMGLAKTREMVLAGEALGRV